MAAGSFCQVKPLDPQRGAVCLQTGNRSSLVQDLELSRAEAWLPAALSSYLYAAVATM